MKSFFKDDEFLVCGCGEGYFRVGEYMDRVRYVRLDLVGDVCMGVWWVVW